MAFVGLAQGKKEETLISSEALGKSWKKHFHFYLAPQQAMEVNHTEINWSCQGNQGIQDLGFRLTCV